MKAIASIVAGVISCLGVWAVVVLVAELVRYVFIII